MSTRPVLQFALAAIVSAALVATVPTGSSAQTPSVTYTVLYKFGTNANDPLQPAGQLAIAQGRDGNLYSTSTYGGTNSIGTMFKVTPSGTLGVVYNFDFDPGDYPFSGVTLGTDGNFYGTTQYNGEGPGSAYKVTPAGVATTLHLFGNTGDGACPRSAPIEDTNGDFYGTTTTVCGGGSQSTVYKLTSSGTLTTLYTWTDGSNVGAPLVQGADGNFYGINNTGGDGYGYIFRMTTSGALTVLHKFTGADGSQVDGGPALIQASDGNFYGTSFTGGSANAGVIFKITPSGTYTVLHNLNGTSDGGEPGNALVQATDGKLYGVAYAGGSSNLGTIFRITTGGTYSVLFNFGGSNGANPESPLRQNTNGVLFGDTAAGGDLSLCSGTGCGVFYSLSIGAKPFVSLVSTTGKVGSKIGILGQGFGVSSVVKFNGVKATTVARTGTTFLLATVPAGASDGKVTVTTGKTVLTSLQTFIVHNSWGSGTVLPTAIQGPAVGVIGGKVYVVGGATSNSTVAINQVYNPATNKWTTGASMPTARFAAAVAVVNNVLYAIGGNPDGHSQTNVVEAYNPKTNTWTTKSPMPTTRDSVVAAVEKGLIYVIGGQAGGSRLATVESYNPATDTWKEEAPLLDGKSETAAGLLGSTIVAADGLSGGGVTGDTEAYNATTNTWSSLTADPTPRQSTCAASFGNLLYVAGGTNGNPLSLNEGFSLTANKWVTFAPLPNAVALPGSAEVNHQLYCFGGSSNSAFGSTVYNYVQIYQP
jgi:uncharacterized repeat protein (TIGR03803 family)